MHKIKKTNVKMGGKITSPRSLSSETPGAVIIENNYAVQDECNNYQPVYVMGYVNTFAVQQFEKNDPEDGLPCESYDEDDVFSASNINLAKHSQQQKRHINSQLNENLLSLQNDKLLIWDGKVLNVATGEFVDTDRYICQDLDKSIVFMNHIIDNQDSNYIIQQPTTAAAYQQEIMLLSENNNINHNNNVPIKTVTVSRNPSIDLDSVSFKTIESSEHNVHVHNDYCMEEFKSSSNLYEDIDAEQIERDSLNEKYTSESNEKEKYLGK